MDHHYGGEKSILQRQQQNNLCNLTVRGSLDGEIGLTLDVMNLFEETSNKNLHFL